MPCQLQAHAKCRKQAGDRRRIVDGVVQCAHRPQLAWSALEQHIVDWFLPYRERELSPRWIRALRRDLALRWSGSAEHSPGMMDKQTLLAVVSQMRARGAFEDSPAVMEAIRVGTDPGAKSAGPMRP